MALVQYRRDDAISFITMDDGKANVLSSSMFDELNAALDRAHAARTVVVLTGRAGMFSGGFDLTVFKQPDRGAQVRMLSAGARITERLLSFPAPVLGLCSGHAIAMGAFLLLSCDFRIGTDDARTKICLNEVQIGMVLPRFGIEVSRQRLTPQHCTRAALTAEVYNPWHAVEAGFLDTCVPAAELASVGLRKAQELAQLSREAHYASKLRLRELTLRALREGIAADIEEWNVRAAVAGDSQATLLAPERAP